MIRLSRDGASFYRAAARQARRPSVRECCRRMAVAKEHLATTLSRQWPTATDGQLPPHQEPQATPSVGLNAGQTTARDFPRLKRAETQLLNVFERALLETDTPGMRSALKRYLPQAESCLRTLADSR